MSEHNIYQRINNVMSLINYVQKDSTIGGAGGGYKAVTHDNVTAEIRPHLVEQGIVIHVEQLKGELLIKRDVKNDVKMHLYSGDYAVSFVNIDKPEDRATVTINAHANDNGDKAPGKAASYAVKYAMLKMFSIETGENEESRGYEAPAFTSIQQEKFDDILMRESAMEFAGFSQEIGNDVMMALQGTFAKGKVSDGKALCKKLNADGWAKSKEYAEALSACINNEDEHGIAELLEELTPSDRRLVAGNLTKPEIAHLKSIG